MKTDVIAYRFDNRGYRFDNNSSPAFWHLWRADNAVYTEDARFNIVGWS
jgi:hypothetical protein